MMRENQIHAASVNIEMTAQILTSHSGTFTMPSREALAPWRRSMHDMHRLSLFPKGEISRVMFLVLTVQCTCGIQHIIQVAARQLTVIVSFIVLVYIKIDRALTLVCVAVGQYLFYQLNLFYDMSGSVRLDTWRQDIELLHSLVIAQSVILHHLHRLQLFQTRLLCYLVWYRWFC